MADKAVDIISALVKQAEETFPLYGAYPYILGVVSSLLTDDQIQILETRLNG